MDDKKTLRGENGNKEEQPPHPPRELPPAMIIVMVHRGSFAARHIKGRFVNFVVMKMRQTVHK